MFTIIAAVINVGLNYLAIKYIGYVGAAFATLASRLVLLVLHYVFSKKLSRFFNVSISTLIISLAVASLAAIFAYCLKQNIAIRIGLATNVGFAGLFYIFVVFIKQKSRNFYKTN